MQRIEADVLVPGRGAPVKDACLVIDGPAIQYAGPLAQAPETPQTQALRVAAVMPGLWDCHTHFMGIRSPDLAELAAVPPVLAAMRVTRDAKMALEAGFTSVRAPHPGPASATIRPASARLRRRRDRADRQPGR